MSERDHYYMLLNRVVRACRAIYARTGYDVAERACWHRWMMWRHRTFYINRVDRRIKP